MRCLWPAVVFFGRRQLQPSLKWMAAFWASIAGALPKAQDGGRAGGALEGPADLSK